MGLYARFWRYSVDTYGGAPLLLLINLVQIAILGWVVSQALRAQAERVAPGISSEARRIRAARRAEIWQKQVRPLAMTMMLLGPVIVLGARRLDEEGSDARGGEPEEVLLHTLKSLLAVTEAQGRRAQADAARIHALLAETLQRGAAA